LVSKAPNGKILNYILNQYSGDYNFNFLGVNMKRMKLLIMLVFTMFVAAAGYSADKSVMDQTSWKITGQLEEACSCDAACPCWFGSKPTHMSCGGGQVLFIEKGNYGDTSIDGLAVGTSGESQDGKTMMESFGNWKFSYLYIDEKANDAQRKALQAIAMTVFGPASPNTEVRYLPITRTIEGKEHKISVGDYWKFHGHIVEGGLGGSAKITNPPAADPIHHEFEQGKTTLLTYKDAGQNWNYSNSNYMFGTFTVDSEQYKKFAAAMAQKMEEMKKSQKPEEHKHK
jgi:hypothetical protein